MMQIYFTFIQLRIHEVHFLHQTCLQCNTNHPSLTFQKEESVSFIVSCHSVLYTVTIQGHITQNNFSTGVAVFCFITGTVPFHKLWIHWGNDSVKTEDWSECEKWHLPCIRAWEWKQTHWQFPPTLDKNLQCRTVSSCFPRGKQYQGDKKRRSCFSASSCCFKTQWLDLHSWQMPQADKACYIEEMTACTRQITTEPMKRHA